MPADELCPTHIAPPNIRVQFSAAQLTPIFIGLDDLVQENNYVRATGSLRRYPNVSDEYTRFGQRPAATDEQLSAVLSALSKVRPRLQAGGWIRLDHRELAACALAVSHAKRLVRKKHAQPWSSKYKPEAGRLLAVIEKYRKRAIKQLPASLQKPAREKIVADLKVVRQRLAPTVTENKQPRCLRLFARDLVAKAVKLALDGLQTRGFERPASMATFRRNVRARLRNLARRGISRSAFLEDAISASLMLADYVIEHSSDLVRRQTRDDLGRSCTQRPQTGSYGASTSVNKAQPLMRAARQKEPPANVRIACGELEWLMMEDFDGKSAWSRMSRAGRVDAVAKAKRAGGTDLSNRRIARIIGVDDKTVARMLSEAALPKAVRTQVSRGNMSGNRALRESNDPALQQAKRITREKADGSVSTKHAEQVVEFVQGLVRGNTGRLVIKRAKDLLRATDPMELRAIVPSWNAEEVIEKARRVRLPQQGPDDIEVVAQRLAWWLRRVAPEPEIHVVALDQAFGVLPRFGVWGSVS